MYKPIHSTIQFFLLSSLTLCLSCQSDQDQKEETITSGNPIFEGWYADPEGAVFGDEYWIFPTYSNRYKQ